MKRASIGTWLNYATSLGFQVIFASRYGTSHAATAFVIVFSLAISMSGLLISTLQSVAVPRLLAPDGALHSRTLRFLGLITALAGLLSLCTALLSGPSAGVLTMLGSIDQAQASALIRWGAAVLFSQFLAGELAAVSIAIGDRLIPTLAPAIPSIVAASVLLIQPTAGVVTAIEWIALGSALEVIVLAALLGRRIRFGTAMTPPLTSPALIMLGSYVLLALITPLERVMAATHGARDAAEYDYAIRSLRGVELLLLGGLVLASLGDWSSLASRLRHSQLADSLLRRAVLGGILLVLAASIAVVAGHSLVEVAYQRGNFTARDTADVTTTLLLGLPGFVAEGIGLIVSPALAGTKHNAELAAIGTTNFVLRLILLAILAPSLGAPGVAIGYSLSQAVLTPALVVAAAKHSLWPRARFRAVLAGSLVAAGTFISALALSIFARPAPALVSGALVTAVCVALFLALRPVPSVRLLA
jgi:peptidoglycan biosynthesis protein MviN/MurJ (putative lipid II flippase)